MRPITWKSSGSGTGRRVVVLVATEREARPLLERLAGVQELVVATKQVYLGSLGKAEAAVVISGCDKANAALVLGCVLQALDTAPDLVLQIGIAGAFSERGEGPVARLGDLVVATREAYSDTGCDGPTGWISVAELGLPLALIDGRECGGVFPLDSARAQWAAGVLRAAIQGAPGQGGTKVLTGPFVTSSTVTGTDAQARAIGERWGALAESMEGAAAAQVCALLGVPFSEVRGISNLVGERDRSKWVVDQAAEAVGWAALALLAALPFEGEVRGG